jgi:hypothetical protein
MYFLKLGFLDGKQGFIFCMLMSMHEFTIGVKLWELEQQLGQADAITADISEI